MPDYRRTTCRSCGRHASKAGAISWSGLCRRCAKRIADENVDGLMAMTDPTIEQTAAQHAAGAKVRDRWRRGMLASIAPQLLDQLKRRQ